MRIRIGCLLAAVILFSAICSAANPQVSSTSPVSGPVGTQVQIYGSGFGASQGSSTVAFGGSATAAVTSWSDGQITATVPTTAVSGYVVVTVGGTQSNYNIYFIVPTPVVSSVTPSSGIIGTQITIAGSGFQATKGSSYISINGGGGNPVVTSWSDTQIVATVPSGVRGTGPVTVTVNNQVSNQDVTFTLPDPVVTGVSPSSGPVGTPAQINGSGFGSTQGASTIKLNNVALTVNTWSDTQITATVPTTAVSGTLQATVGGINSNASIVFTVPAPQITSISPTSGLAGTSVTINGSGFQGTQGSGRLYFNGSSTTPTSWSDTKVVANAPSGVSTGPVEILVNNVPSNTDVVFKMPSPLISGLVPATGPTGTQVQVNGSGFGATQGTSTITLSGVNAPVTSWSDTQIVITVPSTATTGYAQVTVSGIYSNRDVYFNIPGPQITSVSPSSAVAGTQVTINGSAFQSTRGSSSLVYFNGSNATVNSWSDTQIVATVPSGVATGPVKVYVNGVVSNQDVVFTTPDPVITGVSPSSGEVGTQIQISGRGFGATQGTSTVTAYPSYALTAVSWSDTMIVGTVPARARTGALTVTVGTVASNNNVYFTVPLPLVTGISPTSGAGGTQVTVSGSGFQAAQGGGSLILCGYSATISSWSDTQIGATVPTGIAFPCHLYVYANNGDQSNQDVEFGLPDPIVTSVSPTGGTPGTQVTINGSGFGASQATSTVGFYSNYANATVSSWSDTQIVATVPSTASGTGGVKVTVGTVASNTNVNFTAGAVVITSATPPASPVGAQVTVNGKGFGSSTGTISFNGTNATNISSWTDTAIVVTVPTGATTGALKVVNGSLTSNTNVTFTIAGVVVSSVNPASGAAGSQIQINGSGFGATQGSSTLRFATYYSPAIVSWSDSQITATVPSANATGAMVVTVGSVASNANVNFTVVPPAITSISPTSGPVGTQVTINGSGFGASQGSSGITIYGQNAPVVSWSSTQVVVSVPSQSAGGPVVATVNGVASPQAINFTVPAPKVTSISPTSGVVGTQVTVNGSGFGATQGSNWLNFNGGGASIVSWSDTQIVANTAGTATSGPVAVYVNGVYSNRDILFTMPSPQITGVSPSSGTIGAQITVTGTGFGATQGTSALNFYYNYNASIVSWSDTQIVATVPTSAQSGTIKVIEGGVTSNTNINFTVPAPHVTGISPTNGPMGTQVTITGSGFLASRGSNGVYFGNQSNALAQTYTSWSDTQIVTIVPTSAQTGPVQPYIDQVWSNPDALFTLPNPVITGISPSSGPVGTQIQINGSGFGATQGTSTLTLSGGGTVVTPTSWSDTQIVATVPSNVITGYVRVTEGGVGSNININFTVPVPHVASVSPGNGGVGTQVTITGTGFQASQGSGRVWFNGPPPYTYPATIASWSDTQIVAAVPANAITGPIEVTANNGQNSNQDVEFVMPNPQVASLSPTSGPVGTQVQINGSGFGAAQGSNTVAFYTNPLASTSVVSWSDTQIVATVPPAGASGPVVVSVGGVTSNQNIDFRVPSAQITSITPNIGGGNNPVTIVGAGFQATQGSGYVSFSGGSATILSWSDTQIQAIVPNNVVTGPVYVIPANHTPSNAINYTVPNLAVGSLSPSTGPVGTQVTVTGTAFGATQGTSVLTFNGQTPTSISSWSDTQIVAVVPVTATTGPVKVTVNNINSNNTVNFTVPLPWVGGYSPHGGVPGTQVTLSGSGFQANQRNSTVTFNGVPATSIVSWSDTQIVANVPTSGTTGPMLVNVNATTSQSTNSFVVPNPVITSISPTTVPSGGPFTITGSGFGPASCYTPDGVQLVCTGFIQVNGQNYGTISWSDTQIVASYPSPYSGNVAVVNFNATSNSVPITVEGTPTVTSISPVAGDVGSTFTITGTSFGPVQGNSSVQFYGGATAAITSWSDTEIVGTVPPGTATGPVQVVADTIGSTAGGPGYVIRNTTYLTDSLGNQSTYKAEMDGGQWVALESTGSGCSTCTMRGTLTNVLDTNGNLITHFDELGHITNYTYDGNDNITSHSQYLDANTAVTYFYTYNSFGEPLTVTDPLGNVTTNTYDGNGNLLTVATPAPNSNTAASVTQFAYDSKGELTQMTDPVGNITTLTYNPVGLIASIKDAQNNVTSFGYDQHGNRTSVTDALSNQTTYQYDAGDRLTKITNPDQSTVSFSYDYRGRRASVTDQNGKITRYGYDDADRLASVTDAANNVTEYAYDTENNLLSVTDAAGHTTSFTYDAFGRLTQTSSPSTLVQSYLYDAAGNLTSKTDRNGHSILYVYDALNRLVHKGYPDSTGVDYVYDLAGQIKQVSDPTGTYAMAYDNMGRLIGTSTNYAFLPGLPFTNTYAYDANSNRTSMVLPDGSSDSYQYDAMNRLAKITDSLTGQFTFGYDGLGRRTSLARPNGVNTNYSYDSLSNPLSVLHQAGTSILDGATYSYDLAGNRASKTNLLNNITEQYTYDPLNELTQVVQGATTTESYSYDSVGNRLSSQSMGSSSYNISNELTSNSAATFTYDSNGNTLSKTDSTGTRAYAWDFENRLVSVALPGSGGTVTFAYDPFGRRIQKAVTQNSTTTVTNYLYDHRNSIVELDASRNVLARYTQAAGIDVPLAEMRSAGVAYYQQDGLGSVTSLSGSTDTISSSYVYDAFGNLTASTGSFGNPLQYTGRDFDAETGLRYYRARYYDSIAGRFLSEDPIGFYGGMNFYAYTGNNPVLLTDPLGLQECTPEQWAQSPHACAGPTDPNAPYQGPDGLWYNVPELPAGNSAGSVPTWGGGQSSASVPDGGGEWECYCDSLPQYQVEYKAIIDEADRKHVMAFALMVGITSANDGIEHVFEHFGSQFWARRVSPYVEAFDLIHGLQKNIEAQKEVNEKMKDLKKRLHCKTFWEWY